MRRVLLLGGAVGAAYVLGLRRATAAAPDRHLTVPQRAAVLWMSPRAVRARRAVKRRTRRLRS